MTKSKKNKILITVLVLFVVGVSAGWLLAPKIATHYVNHALSHVEGYHATVGSVAFPHILRGAVVVNNVNIEKKNGKVSLPFVSIARTEFTLQWSQLFRGHVVGVLDVESPRINFVQGPTEAQSQLKVQKEWQDVATEMLPVRLNEFTARNAQVHFVSTKTKPKVDIFLKDVQVKGKNLSNSKEKADDLFSTVEVKGKALGNGTFEVHARANPLTKPLPAFRMKMQLRDVDLVALNDFFQAYGKFDVKEGKFDFFFEIDSTPTTYKGYAKPMLSHIDVFDWEKDTKRKNFIQVAWQAMVGTVSSVFKNQPKDRIATETPFSGTWKKTDVGIFETVLNLLENAFVKALLPGFEPGGAKKVS
jgi:hypothetical protein